MLSASLKGYSIYVSLMKKVLPIGIVLALGFSVGWPYFQSIVKERIVSVEVSHTEIQENRMVQPHYVSTDNKGQPYHVKAEWAKQRTETVADLTNPQGSLITKENQSFDLKAKKGLYDNEGKTLNLEGDVTLVSTDGYHVKTEKAQVTLDSKLIEGNTYIEGEGPTGSIRGRDGFKVENRPQGKILTLKGPSRVVIAKKIPEKSKDGDS